MIFVLIPSVLATLVFLHYLWLYYTDTSRYKIPVFNQRNVPLFGHMLSMPSRENMLKQRFAWYKEMGDTFVFWVFHQRYVFSRDPKVVEDLLSSQKYLKKAYSYWVIKEGLGEGLVVSEGDFWRKRRKIITPTFHFEILNDYFSIIEKQAAHLMAKLYTLAEQKQEFDIQPISKDFAFSVICETAMGINMEKEDKECGYAKWIKTAVRLIVYRSFRPWLWNPTLFKLTKNGRDYFEALRNMRKFVRSVIERRIEMRENNEGAKGQVDTSEMDGQKRPRKLIFIDALLDAYKSGDIDVQGIMEEVFTFISAGHDTTSSTLAWCLYLLARNTSVQEKLYKEVQHVATNNLDSGGLIDNLKELKYMEYVIKESLRIHPAIPSVSRTLEHDTVLGGIKFPPTPGLVVDIISLHRDPKIWENPLSFIPERFEKLSDNQKRIFAFIPFSAGPRNCIGQRFAMMELKVALFHILKRFRVHSTQSEKELQETVATIHTSDNGLMLSLNERN